MSYNHEQTQAAYKKLPEEVQDFIMSNDTSDLTAEYFKEAGLSDDDSILADSEIFYAMLGLKSLGDAVKSISGFTKKPLNDLSKLESNLKSNIFMRLEELDTQNVRGTNLLQENSAAPENKRPSVPEIPPQILPETLPDQVAHEVPHIESAPQAESDALTFISSAPLPPKSEAQPEIKKEEPKGPTVEVYKGGVDPYREPLE